MSERRQDAIVLIASIVERGAGSRVARAYTRRQIPTHLRCKGRGTATSEIMDILGLGSTEKDVLLSLSTRAAAERLMAELEEGLGSDLRTGGIAFTLPLTGIGSLTAASVQLSGKLEKSGGGETVKESDNSLILISVNQGFTGPVMETAKKAGARGGTILRARWTGAGEMTTVLQLQEEREVIAIVAPREKRAAIMEAVNAAHGARTEAGGEVLSLAVEHLARF